MYKTPFANPVTYYNHVYYVLYISVNSQVTELGISADQLLSACSISSPQDTSCQVSSCIFV